MASVALEPGRLIEDKFRLERSLGVGGMAEVMLAEDVVLDRQVALKFLGTSLLTDPTARERFAIEARNMARVRHDNVVQVYSFGTHEGWPYFVMEYVPGGTLATWRRAHENPPIAAVLDIVRRVALGLEAIHDVGLVHHDIKPSNILLGMDGRVVITDLGLSRLVWRSGSPSFAGTPRYMAPEQLDGRALPPELAPRTDIFQLGVTTFELLVGAVPDDLPPPCSCEEARLVRAPRPSQHRADLGPAIDEVILTALADRPEDRYASATELADALERAASARTRTHPPSPVPPLRVLVADDEPAHLSGAAALLSGSLPIGSSVICAADGDEAFIAAREKHPDVLVLDLHMPGMSALDVTRALRGARASRRPRIVVVTADGGVADWKALREIGVDAFLLKPFDADQLLSAVMGPRLLEAV